MLDFKDRLKKEYFELMSKYSKLISFIGALNENGFTKQKINSDKIPNNLASLDIDKRIKYLDLLNSQAEYMKNYLRILVLRTELLGIELYDNSDFKKEYEIKFN